MNMARPAWLLCEQMSGVLGGLLVYSWTCVVHSCRPQTREPSFVFPLPASKTGKERQLPAAQRALATSPTTGIKPALIFQAGQLHAAVSLWKP